VIAARLRFAKRRANRVEYVMSRPKLTVVLSQAQGKNPAKRALEESLAAALIMEPGIDVSILPYLYDLDANHTGRLFLESVSGDMVVLAWMYPRAVYWLLDRVGVKGHFGETRIKPAPEDDDEGEEKAEPEPPKGIGAVGLPDRHIYPIDLRDESSHAAFVAEIRRVAVECRERRAVTPQNEKPAAIVQLGVPAVPAFVPEQLLQQPGRRWYPVIDYSRCTNCMECLDFCLFGVYGVDSLDRLHVENQDNCKKGCPACSRVCPEHAIMFPDYKTPAIAGAAVGSVSGLKIDLSRLFGGGDALSIAAQERDRELVADGRAAVGLTVGIPKRQAEKPQGPKDDLDKLMDALDNLDI
jgi:Pyruvate/2-oxoacid:ferredoxin oxidoreductase delta subunit